MADKDLAAAGWIELLTAVVNSDLVLIDSTMCVIIV